MEVPLELFKKYEYQKSIDIYLHIVSLLDKPIASKVNKWIKPKIVKFRVQIWKLLSKF